MFKKQPSLPWFAHLAEDRRAWFEFSEKVISLSFESVKNEENDTNRVACASKKVNNSSVQKVYRPITLL